MRSIFFYGAVGAAVIATATAFVPPASPAAIGQLSNTKLLLAKTGASNTKPRFNKSTDKWERAPADDGVYPYDAIGALLRHGPSPFLTRITNAEEYEQYVLNYMAEIGVDRAEATGNIDAKINNAADWAYQKMEESKGRPKVDYTELKAKNAVLAIVWAVFITPLTVSVILQTISQLGDGMDAYNTYRG